MAAAATWPAASRKGVLGIGAIGAPQSPAGGPTRDPMTMTIEEPLQLGVGSNDADAAVLQQGGWPPKSVRRLCQATTSPKAVAPGRGPWHQRGFRG